MDQTVERLTSERGGEMHETNDSQHIEDRPHPYDVARNSAPDESWKYSVPTRNIEDFFDDIIPDESMRKRILDDCQSARAMIRVLDILRDGA